MKINKLRLKDKKNYRIIEFNAFNNENEVLDNIGKELEQGAEIIHINCTNSNTRLIIEAGKKIRSLCSIYNALFIINDRIDIAQIIEADGVFLDENSFNIKEARELLGNTIIIGTNYNIDGADYLLLNSKITVLH